MPLRRTSGLRRRYASASKSAGSLASIFLSTDPLQSLGILVPPLHVPVGGERHRLGGFLVERLDGARGCADDQRIVRTLLALAAERAGADQRMLPDRGA